MRSSHILTRVILFVILVSLVAAPAPASSQASNDESADKTVHYKVQPQADSALVDPLQADGEPELNSGISRIDETDARQLAGAADQATPAVISNDLGDEYWAAGFGPSGMNNLVRALAFGPDGSLYAGGDFTTAGGATAQNVAHWDGTAWHPLGSGMGGDYPLVDALVFGPDGALYAGGWFTTAGGMAANNIARWDGTAWHPLGSGMDSYVFALAFGPDGFLYAGGYFTQAGGATANRIARWDGTAWLPLGSGMNSEVLALAFGPDGSLYAGGGFTTAGSATANGIARWDGAAWYPLGSGINGTVKAMAFAADGSLYAGGGFNVAGGETAYYIARWADASWHSLGSGPGSWLSNQVLSLAFGADGSLYVGGEFWLIGNVVNYIARWDGSAWHSLDSGMGGGYPHALAFGPDGSLYAGGGFTTAGGVLTQRIARWDGTSWHALGHWLNGGGIALAAAPDGSLYAGGTFVTADGRPANGIARWDGAAWHSLASGMCCNSPYVNALAVGPDGSLYAGGYFTQAGGVTVNYIARWDGTMWHALGSGLNSYVGTLAVGSDGSLYAGGDFTAAGGTAVSRIARWDGTIWHALGGGMNSFVRALAVGPDGSLYAGGDFNTAGGVTVDGIARWDGSAWHPLASGINGTVFALAVGPDGSLYTGGDFNTAGGVTVDNIARWDGTSWHPLGSGMSDGVTALAVGLDGSLYAGGGFTTAGGVSANRIARWDGVSWHPLGSGIGEPSASALAFGPDGSLYAGGGFTTAGGKPSWAIALWTRAVIQSIRQIEINQAIGRQYEGAQKYVAGKETAIRVQLSLPILVDSSNQQVVVRRNGNYVATLHPEPSAESTNVLTFLCNQSECGNWAAGNYVFEATIGGQTAQKAVVFSDRRNLRILAVPVKVSDQGTIRTPDDSWKSGDVFLRQVYPVAADGVIWEFGAELDATSYDLTQEGICFKIGPWGPGRCRLWKDVRDRQPFLCGLPMRPACYDMIVGFIPAMRTVCQTGCETCGCPGGGTFGKPATIVMTNGSFDTPCPNLPMIDINSMRSSVAHELGHIFHNPLGDEYNHPYAHYQCDNNPPPPNYEGTYWGDPQACSNTDRCTTSEERPWLYGTGTGSLVDSETAHPFELVPTLPGSNAPRGALPDVLGFMGSGRNQQDMWVTPRSYNHLFDQLAPSVMTEWVPNDPVDAVVVSGWIGQDDSVGFDPWYQVSVSLGDPATGAYSVEAIDSTGQVLASQGFDVSFTALNNPPQIIDPAPFEAVVTSPSGTVAFRIKHGATILATVPISAHAPIVQVTAPTTGQVLSGPSTITWQSQDQDGDELYHTVEYSPDGQDWQVLAAAITQTQFIADFAKVPGSTLAQVRVIVSDGVNTATATSAAFTVVRTPPEVTIYAPPGGGLTAWASTITFSGGAYDYRDGWLRDPAVLTWSSDRDGALGGGEVLRVSTLSPGLHTITLAATNSVNLTASTVMTLTVGMPGDLNGDGCILVDDITGVATAWTQNADPPLDLNGDGVVTVADIEIAAIGWDGLCVPTD